MSPIRTRDDPTARRAQILATAIRVIGERGYYGFTVQELAMACGLSNAGLLHHFPSKEQLLLATLEQLEAEAAAFVGPFVQDAEREPRERRAVINVLRVMAQRSVARPQLLRFFAEIQVEALNPAHPAHPWWRRRERVTMDLFVKLLGPHVEAPLSVARQLLAMIDGVSLRWLWADQGFDLEAEWERAFRQLLPALFPDGQAAAPTTPSTTTSR